jgi:rubrerythrin
MKEGVFMSKTEKNLKDAFAGESQANRTYLAFAKKAEEEGYPQVARLFRAVAEAETVHAHNHLRVLQGIKSTSENIQEAIGGETHEFKTMYPEMIKDAKEEGNKEAMISFNYANQVEKIHAELYHKALENLGKEEKVTYYVCPICGYTVENNPPDTCPICNRASASDFMKFE